MKTCVRQNHGPYVRYFYSVTMKLLLEKNGEGKNANLSHNIILGKKMVGTNLICFRWNATHCIVAHVAYSARLCVCLFACVSACVRTLYWWTKTKQFEIDSHFFTKLQVIIIQIAIQWRNWRCCTSWHWAYFLISKIPIEYVGKVRHYIKLS